MNDSELFSQGNEAYVDENYQLALQKYSAAIDLNGFNPEYYVKRATTHIKLGNYKDACTDANVALHQDPNNIKAHLRKGVSLFHLGEYVDALETFEQGLKMDEENQEIKSWLSKCNTELGIKDGSPDHKQERTAPTGAESSNNDYSKTKETLQEETREEPKKQEEEQPKEIQKPLVRHDWYQTETHVVVALMIKSCHAQNVSITYNTQRVAGTVSLPTGGEYKLDFNLAHPINAKECKTRILQSKIELKLKKSEAIHWISLEKTLEATKIKSFSTATKTEPKESIDIVHQYPSSRHVVKDWDRLAADITKNEEDEKEEGEAALSALFQKIYGEGGDAVKKAMNKSFVESGGTVLSTNWDEVGKEKVERKPPDGMEWREWEH